MIYQIVANLFIKNEGISISLYKHLESIMKHAQTINPDSANYEVSSIKLIECHHNETPPGPCHEIEFCTTGLNQPPVVSAPLPISELEPWTNLEEGRA
jgi:hypothetical protein